VSPLICERLCIFVEEVCVSNCLNLDLPDLRIYRICFKPEFFGDCKQDRRVKIIYHILKSIRANIFVIWPPVQVFWNIIQNEFKEAA